MKQPQTRNIGTETQIGSTLASGAAAPPVRRGRAFGRRLFPGKKPGFGVLTRPGWTASTRSLLALLWLLLLPGVLSVFGAPGVVFTSLHSFGGNEGAVPNGLVRGRDGSLYGTTLQGGAHTNLYAQGAGTVFQISTNGVFASLYSFIGNNDHEATISLYTQHGVNEAFVRELHAEGGTFRPPRL